MKANLSPPLMYSYLCFIAASLMLITSAGYSWKANMTLLQWPLMSSSFPVSLMVMFDTYSLIFSAIVLIIAANVLLFTKSYMAHEPFILRFIHLVMLFVSSMLILIFLPNLVTLMIGWDGLGLVSFLLVIYYQNSKSLGAGMLTALSNRVGDALMIISLALVLTQHHYLPNLWLTPSWCVSILILAGFTKSAQMPFSAWLPAAMAAPTPVSALVHSSTLVTAGVYLLFRLSPSIMQSSSATNMCLVMGGSTMCMSGIVAMIETDMKKVIALSTLSQLGLMVFSIGLSQPVLAFFHMATHAIFKALMFICTGHLISLNSHNQDMRTAKAGITPLIASCLSAASLALSGIPFLSAFYSKDAILEITPVSPINLWIYTLLVVSTGLTAAYSSRLILASLSAPPSIMSSTEDNMFTPFPMIMLTLTAIVSGAALNWTLIQPLALTPLNQLSKTWPLIIIILGICLSLPQINHSPASNSLFSTMMYIVPLSTILPLKPCFYTNNALTTMDQGWNEFMGGSGMNHITSNMYYKMASYEPHTTLLQLIVSLSMGVVFFI